MNKIKYLIGLAITGIIAISIPVSTVLVTSVGLSSCKDSCDTCIDIPVVPIPILTINPPQATVFDVSWGENVDFHIEAKSNIKSNKDLRDVKFEVLYSVGDPFDTTWYPKSTEKKFFTINYTYIVPPSANPDDVITIKVTATDVDGKAKLNTFILTVKDLSGLKVYNDIILGAQANATYGSFYASSTNTVYNINSAKVQGQTTVDFIYYYGNVKTATLAAPAFADFGTGSGELAVFEVDKWSTRRATKFKKTAPMSEDEWKSLTAASLQQKYATSSSTEDDLAPFLTDFTGGGFISHYLFKTASSKNGIFRVDFISLYNGSGYIKIDVKVMK